MIESNLKKLGTSDNNVFTLRQTSRLGPGRKVDEVAAGTHPFTQPHRGQQIELVVRSGSLG